MANTKISALANGNPAQSGDLIPIARAGANFSLTAQSVAALASGASVLKSVSIQLTPAQLENLSTTPVTLLAAEVGHYFSIINGIFEFVAGSTPYVVNNNTLLNVVAAATSAQVSEDNLITSVSTLQDLNASSIMTTSPIPSSAAGNVPIVINTTGGPDVSGGNGVLNITMYYVDFVL